MKVSKNSPWYKMAIKSRLVGKQPSSNLCEFIWQVALGFILGYVVQYFLVCLVLATIVFFVASIPYAIGSVLWAIIIDTQLNDGYASIGIASIFLILLALFMNILSSSISLIRSKKTSVADEYIKAKKKGYYPIIEFKD